MAFVDSIHFEGESTKELLPASNIKASNSTPLKFGLLILSHRPRNSIVLLLRIQFFTTSFGSVAFLNRAMSVIEMNSSFPLLKRIISVPLTLIFLIFAMLSLKLYKYFGSKRVRRGMRNLGFLNISIFFLNILCKRKVSKKKHFKRMNRLKCFLFGRCN